jgi:hypothetical protein
MTTMRAIVLDAPGPPDALTCQGKVELDALADSWGFLRHPQGGLGP